MKNLKQNLMMGLIVALVGLSIVECHSACCVANIHNPVVHTALLGVSYAAVILVQIKMYRRKEANTYVWLLRCLIVILACIPQLLQHSTVGTSNVIIALVLLISLEILIDFWLWAFGK